MNWKDFNIEFLIGDLKDIQQRGLHEICEVEYDEVINYDTIDKIRKNLFSRKLNLNNFKFSINKNMRSILISRKII